MVAIKIGKIYVALKPIKLKTDVEIFICRYQLYIFSYTIIIYIIGKNVYSDTHKEIDTYRILFAYGFLNDDDIFFT